jgi:hypothetical protein
MAADKKLKHGPTFMLGQSVDEDFWATGKAREIPRILLRMFILTLRVRPPLFSDVLEFSRN